MTNEDDSTALATPQSQPIKLTLELSPRLPEAEPVTKAQADLADGTESYLANLSPYFNIDKSIDDCERRLKCENNRYQDLM